MAVSKRTRYEVLNRDGFACRYCHETDIPLTIDHVVPVSLGGSDKPDNLVAACQPCNAGKSSSNPDSETVNDVQEDALRWAGALQKAAEILAAKEQETSKFFDLFLSSWGRGWLPDDADHTIARLHSAGLNEEMLIYSINAAQSARGIESSRFRYFCGVAWRRVNELQDLARQIIEEAD